jgi:hypothetical protein
VSPQDAATRLSAVAGDLATALATEETATLAPMRLLDQACDLVGQLSWAMCREPAAFPLGDLREIARNLAAEFTSSPRDPRSDEPGVQAEMVSAQAHDLAAAYRRWTARGSRPGVLRDVVEGEVATVLVATAIFAEMAGIDIDRAIGRQVALTRSRGGQEASQAATLTGRADRSPRTARGGHA